MRIYAFEVTMTDGQKRSIPIKSPSMVQAWLMVMSNCGSTLNDTECICLKDTFEEIDHYTRK